MHTIAGAGCCVFGLAKQVLLDINNFTFGPHELWVITVTNSKHIVNNLNGYEGINLIQSPRPKLQLPDLVCTLCQNSHL